MTQFLHKQLKKQFKKMQWNHSTRRRIQIEIPKEREKAVEIEVEGSMICQFDEHWREISLDSFNYSTV